MTNDEETQEIVNCALSFDYWINNYAWIEDKVNSTAIQFKLWPSQLRILPLFLTALRLILLKARQLGLTWMTAAYSLWLAMFHSLQLIVVISAKEDWAIEFLDRVKFIFDLLPVWMKPKVLKRTGQELTFGYEEKDALGNTVIKGLNSTIKSLATTPEGAQSKTVTLLVLDETARNRYVKQIWGASKPGLDSGQGRVIVISNSIKDGVGWSWTRKIFTDSMSGLNDFVRIFMGWFDHPARPKDFIERQKREGMDEEDISQHYPATEEEAISTMLGSYFGKTLARHKHATSGIRGYLERDRKGDIRFINDSKGILEVWRFPYHLVDGWDGLSWLRRYAIGSDISEGLGQTDSAGYVLDRHFDEFVCRIRSNRVDADQWGYVLKDVGEWYDNALICPERTGAGITTCNRLANLGYNNLYVREVPAKVGSGLTKEIGWSESNQSKHILAQDLKTYFRNTEGAVYCGVLIEQSSTFIRHENGKLGHEEDAFDDCVIGAGCAIQAGHFIGEPPEQVKPDPTGWLPKWQKGAGEDTIWTR